MVQGWFSSGGAPAQRRSSGTSTTYTLTGKPATATDANNNTTSFSYDLLDRLSSYSNRYRRWIEPLSLELAIGITDSSVAVRHGKDLQCMIVALDDPPSERHKRNAVLYPFGDNRIYQYLRVICRGAKP